MKKRRTVNDKSEIIKKSKGNEVSVAQWNCGYILTKTGLCDPFFHCTENEVFH